MTKKRSRGWCFTLNNYTAEDMANISSIYVTQKELQCEYLIMGFEVGRNKTPHIQGYLYFKNEKSFKQLQDMHPSWHVEKQAAKQNVHAYTYCMKDGDFIEYGKRPSQGNRSDLEVIKHDLKRGRPMKDISDEFFQQYCQYRRSFDAYLELHNERSTQVIGYDYQDDKHIVEIAKYPGNNYYCEFLENKLEIIKKIRSRMYDYVFVNVGSFPDELIDKIL